MSSIKTLYAIKNKAGFWDIAVGPSEYDQSIGTVHTNWYAGMTPDSTKNFALKFAASQQMFEALTEIVEYSGGADSALEDPYVMDRLRLALAKAEGRQP